MIAKMWMLEFEVGFKILNNCGVESGQGWMSQNEVWFQFKPGAGR